MGQEVSYVVKNHSSSCFIIFEDGPLISPSSSQLFLPSLLPGHPIILLYAHASPCGPLEWVEIFLSTPQSFLVSFFLNITKVRRIHVPVEFIPASHQYLLTVLSIWWAIGQVVGSLVSDILNSVDLLLTHYTRLLGH